ncbi:hypothetical protein Cva_01587 [Caedimonas varicaedens]|uniref:Uncharacterized protein n=1 Tax=Caedimonas varicaedens TaxID=1629334 RepID=A0A0K8MEL0_9PROT|nr:hypothetical protein Cva_01587 [Caedimonas varicaedens]
MGIYGRHVSSINSFREPRCVAGLPVWQKPEPLIIPSCLTCPEEIKAYVYLTTIDRAYAPQIKTACDFESHKQCEGILKQLIKKKVVKTKGDGLYSVKQEDS